MNHRKQSAILLTLLSVCCVIGGADEPSNTRPESQVPPPATIDDARARAKLLHETIRGTLQVVHRDFFDEDDVHAIPSASMEDVFDELDRSFGVHVKWLNVQTDVLNIDHNPEGEFETAAAKAIAAGKPFYEAQREHRYQYAGRIRLASQCLKCHVKNRLTAKDRSAGLLISMPLSTTAATPLPGGITP